MQTEVEKRATNTARHGAFGVGDRFVKPRAPDSAAVSTESLSGLLHFDAHFGS